MLWRRPVLSFFAEASGQAPGSAGARKLQATGSLWSTRPVLVVPQANCLYSELSIRGVPFKQWRNFFRMQLTRLSPYEHTQSHVELHGQTAQIWYWNGAKTTVEAGKYFVLPHTLVFSNAKTPAPRQSLGLRTFLGAWWWQQTPAAQTNASPFPWLTATALAGMCALGGFLGFHASQWHGLDDQSQRLTGLVRQDRQSAFKQLADLRALDDAKAAALALAPYKATPTLADAIACVALATANGGFLLRDMDIRAGSFSANLASLGQLDMDDVTKSLAQCKLLADTAIDPGQDSKTARVTARLVSAVALPMQKATP